MKILLKVLIILAVLLGFWGICELLILLPIFEDVHIKDLKGIYRLFYLLWTLFQITIGYLYGYFAYELGKKLFIKINKL